MRSFFAKSVFFLFWGLLLASFFSCTSKSNIQYDCNADRKIENGIYYGVKTNFYLDRYVAFIIVENDRAAVEFFFPGKDQYLEIFSESLVADTDLRNNILFTGAETNIICENGSLYIKQKNAVTHVRNNTEKRNSDFIFKEIFISLMPEKIRELHEYKNRSYLNNDFDETVEFFNSCKGCVIEKGQNISAYEGLLNKYGVEELVLTKNHDEFVKEFKIIKQKVMEEIKNIR